MAEIPEFDTFEEAFAYCRYIKAAPCNVKILAAGIYKIYPSGKAIKSPAPVWHKYIVTNWQTQEAIAEFEDLNEAKKFCRGLGHTGQAIGGYYPPVAFVADIDGYLVYNPRFAVKKEV